MTAAHQDLFSLFGGPVVLLEVRPKTKKPIRKAWEQLTLADMTPEYLAGLNGGCNIGVSLGQASRGLISIDLDQKDRWDEMLTLNPSFPKTLLSSGARGGNIWLYIDGDCPASCTLRDTANNKVAEFRANRNQTIIRGIHENGRDHYRNNGCTPLLKRLDEIVWADDVVLPWVAPKQPAADFFFDEARLIAECGAPFVIQGRSVKINHAYFVKRFCKEHHVLFETTAASFFLYENTTGAWQYADSGAIKELVRLDWLRISARAGGNALSVLGTDTLLNQFVSGIRSAAGRADAFKRLSRGLLHLGNSMLQAPSYEMIPFSPTHYSRNPIPINFNSEAKCPKFRELIETQVPKEDQSLVQRWLGSCLLQGNAAQRLMVFTGIGATSKSTIVNVAVKLIGHRNVGALRTHLLNERFEIGRFVAKTLLTACDVPGTFLQHKSAQVIKKLVGGDYVPGEVKGVMREVPIFGDFAMAITCNETLLVRLYGDSDVSAWRRRLLLVNFSTPIDPAKRVDRYDDVLLAEEAEGILLYFLEGAAAHLKELKQCGDFRLSDDQKERIERLLTESQSLRFFVKGEIVISDGKDLTTEEIVKAYFIFCKERNFASRLVREVELELKELMLEIHSSHYTNHVLRNKKNMRGYQNAAFKAKCYDDVIAAEYPEEEPF